MMYKRALLIVMLLACPVGQVGAGFYPLMQYDPPTWLAPGVSYRHARDLTVPWQIDIIELDLTHPNVELVPVIRQTAGVTETVSAMAARSRAVAAVNGGYFSAASATSLSYARIDGIQLAQNPVTRPPRSVFGCWGNHNARLLQTPIDATGAPQPDLPEWSRTLDALGGGPNLVTAGMVDVTDVAEGFDAASGVDPNGRQPRTALGWDSSMRRVFLVTVDGRQPGWSVGMTLEELARLLVDLGCTRGLNYDGGGSTTCWVSDSVVNQPSDGNERPVVTAWAVVPALVMDNHDAQAVISGNWFASANSGYYDLDSLVNSGGTGSDHVTWNATLQRGGLYEVYAWWVAAANRPVAARYRVLHAGGGTDVLVDQTTVSARWNLLGTFAFDAAPGEGVRLDDAAPADRFVSADAVRIVALAPDPVDTIVDDGEPGFATTGAWSTSSAQPDRYGATYRFSQGGNGADVATWSLDLARSGMYEVCVWYSVSANRAVDAPYTVTAAGGDVTTRINQQSLGGRWVKLGEFPLHAGPATIALSDDIANPSQVVVADAVMAVRRPTPPGDTDFDGDLDVTDAGILDDCLHGPNQMTAPPCDLLDLNGDGDVDLDDFAGLQLAITPP